jgi:serine phosphatase RsbU (regulator of sigma subunit)
VIKSGKGRIAPEVLLRRICLLPSLLLALGVIVDLFTPPEVSAAAFFSAAPVVAAPLLSLRGTVLVGLAACTADLAVLARYGLLTDAGAYSDWASVVTVAALAVFLNRLLHRRETRLRLVKGIAAAVQRAVLPQPPARIGPVRVAAHYEAAQTDAQIGGDLYAVQDTPYGVRCLMGDVRGKGMGAVETVTVVLGAFREGAQREPTLTGLAEWIEQSLFREAAQRERQEQGEEFTTAVLAEIPRPGDRIRLVNRGHPAPLLLVDGVVHQLEPSRPALPLGLAPLGADPSPLDTVAFPEGAGLLLYTDGVTEARDRDAVFYPLPERAARLDSAPPPEWLAALRRDLLAHVGGRLADDAALVAVEREG